MTQHTLTLRALFFEKLTSAFLTLGLPFLVLVLAPVLAVLVRDYVVPTRFESKPPPHIENEPSNSDQKKEIENRYLDAVSRAQNATQVANAIEQTQNESHAITVSTVKSTIVPEVVIAGAGSGGSPSQTVVPLRQ
jgi:hypothetical protein